MYSCPSTGPGGGTVSLTTGKGCSRVGSNGSSSEILERVSTSPSMYSCPSTGTRTSSGTLKMISCFFSGCIAYKISIIGSGLIGSGFVSFTGTRTSSGALKMISCFFSGCIAYKISMIGSGLIGSGFVSSIWGIIFRGAVTSVG